MSRRLLERVLVPVANQADTEATCQAIEPYLDQVGEIILLHVVEQTEGFMDQAPPAALEEDARGFLELATDRLDSQTVTRIEVRFGTDVSEEIADEARRVDASAITFRPREKSLLERLLGGTEAPALLKVSPVPVVSLPSPDGEG